MLVYWKKFMSDELFDYLLECNNKIGKILVGNDFINHRNTMKELFKAGDRTERERLMSADCLLVEYMLLKNNYVQPSVNIAYDFSYKDDKVDVKVISSKYFNIPGDKCIWYMQNIRSYLLTKFAFYKYEEAPKEPLKIGDVVSFRLIEVSDAEKVMSSVKPSRGDGYYYALPSLQ
jgi:hypothetical protein